jgi:membrane-associated phospholipid phosphatase
MVLRKKHCAFLILLMALDAMSQSARTSEQSELPEAPSAAMSRSSIAETHEQNQEPDRDWLPPGTDPENKLGWTFVKHLAGDQKTFWTSARDLDHGGARTFVPFVGFTGLLIASDSWMSKQVPDKPNQVNRSNTLSNLGVYSLVGAAGGSFVWGHLTKNDHLREAGLLSFETVLNSTAVAYALKSAAQRERPLEGDRNGNFFRGGSSFPSEHSVVAWSIASVMAHEYPSSWSQFLSYGLASAVSLSRVTSKNHFPSDVVVGGALGWYLGRQIYRAHHDTTLGGGPWGAFVESTTKMPRKPENMGSPYVPIDSWVYPAFDRLAALGFVHGGYAGMRPWTRIACADLLEEASEKLRYGGQEGSEASRLYDTLVSEFDEEMRRLDNGDNLGASIDSVYTRVTGISGKPLRDGYHFGQTIINDYGRPYGEGFNAISGITAHAVAGPFSLYVQGEYQHAPAVASDPPSVLQATANQDLVNPLPNGTPSIDRFRLMTASAAFMFRGLQFSFGKQSLWLGPGDSGPFLFSDNAEPIPMFRIDQVFPSRIPGLSKILGPMRAEFFLGQLSGHQFVFSDGTLFGPDSVTPQPFIHGSKISFKPTQNLEFGLGYTVLFGGPDLPFTWHNFLRTFTAFNEAPGSATDPGDRRSTFDLSYRIPGLRNWVSAYVDSFVEDEISPLGSTRPSMRMGVYLPKTPKLSRLDLRMEGIYTDVPGQKTQGFLYWNGRYRSGYTNDRQLLASWIGRQGRGGQAWATYWLSPRSKFQLNYRHAEVDKVFIGGGRMNDFGARGDFMLHHSVALSGMVQYEQWKFPVISTTGESNVTASFQLTFYPKWSVRK